MISAYSKKDQNECQKMKSGKLLPFSILTHQKDFLFQSFPGWEVTQNFPYFSRLRRNPVIATPSFRKLTRDRLPLTSACIRLRGNPCSTQPPAVASSWVSRSMTILATMLSGTVWSRSTCSLAAVPSFVSPVTCSFSSVPHETGINKWQGWIIIGGVTARGAEGNAN